MLGMFSALYSALYENAFIALSAAFLWGVMSIILSPCHLGSIPLIIGYISGNNNKPLKNAFLSSFLFAVGILVTIVLIGITTGLMGRMLGDIGIAGKYLMSIILFVMGLYLFGVFYIPSLAIKETGYSGKRILLGAFFLGLLFGLALGPCSFAYLAPLLAIVFSEGSRNLFFSFSLVFAYALGHCSVIVFVGTFADAVQKYLKWNKNLKMISTIKRVCGILILIAAVYVLFI